MSDEQTPLGERPEDAGRYAVRAYEEAVEELGGEAFEPADTAADADSTGDISEAAQAVKSKATAAVHEVAREAVPAAAKAAYQEPERMGFGLPVLIGSAVAALAIGLLAGRFLLGGGAPAATASPEALAGKTSVTESELDTPMATYTYNGEAHNVTVRDVILGNSSLTAAMDAEGNYYVPSADSVLAVVRNQIIETEAQSRNITVTDEELAAYSETTLGTSDYASIAASYGMDEASVVALLRNSAVMSRLRDEVVGAAVNTTMPEAPVAPEESYESQLQYNEETGEEEWVDVPVDANQVTSPDYAAYIINLAGAEWDGAAGTWASFDGPFAQALANYEIYPDSATYEAAQTAYYVAYQLYSQSMSNSASAWTSFVNGLLSNANITISTLVA